MMRRMTSVIGLLLAFAGTPALAFEETKQRVAPPQEGAAPGAKSQAKRPLNLEGTGTSIDPSPSASSGPDIRIPGLGKLGVWPKLDFGLDVLYGGREGSKIETPDPGRSEPSDGVQIRGHIKHRW